MVELRWLWAGLLVGAFACGDDGSSEDSSDGALTSSGMTTQGSSATGSASSSQGDTEAPMTTSATSFNPETTTGDDPTTGSETSDPLDGSGRDDSGEQGGGTIDVTLSGCAIDFGGTVVVSYNGSLGVASVYDMGGSLSGSFQFELDGPDTFALSSQHRVDTGTVVNMVDTAAGTWTNLDSDALTGGVDTIGGTLIVSTWEPAMGISEIEFQSVSLRNVVDGNVCTIDGTIATTELYP